MAASPLEELDGWERDLLAEARVARLGLLDAAGDPRVLPVTYAIAASRIWTAIDHKRKRPGSEPARLGFLRERPRVALTADRYDDDWSRLAWVQALGTASIQEPADEPGALAALADKYEPYRERPPAGPLIAIKVDRILTWRA